MIKYYCDGCGGEIERNYVTMRFSPRLELGGVSWQAEVMITRSGTTNKGELCLECVKKILNEKEG